MKKSEKTRITVSKILEAALAEFGTNGYGGGTVNNICKAGINKGLIYHNFAGKDALYLACLRHSTEKLIGYIRGHGGAADLKRYLAVRGEFIRDFPMEARIFFEALLTPPPHLAGEIRQTLAEFHTLNEEVYKSTLDTVVLRSGVTVDDALACFHMMQTALNGYFGSPAFQNVMFQETIKEHENAVPKLFDFLLYGIAKGETQP